MGKLTRYRTTSRSSHPEAFLEKLFRKRFRKLFTAKFVFDKTYILPTRFWCNSYVVKLQALDLQFIVNELLLMHFAKDSAEVLVLSNFW